jgi:hypothetical protein
LLLTSSVIVRVVYHIVAKKEISKEIMKQTRDTGFVIGICENFLILTFILVGEFTALALIFAAKGIIRKDDFHENSLYFLACTMVNFTYSIFIGMLMLFLLEN